MITKLVRSPIDVPDDLPRFLRGSLNRFDRVLGEFPEKLKRMAILSEPVQKETDVINRQVEGVLARD